MEFNLGNYSAFTKVRAATVSVEANIQAKSIQSETDNFSSWLKIQSGILRIYAKNAKAEKASKVPSKPYNKI